VSKNLHLESAYAAYMARRVLTALSALLVSAVMLAPGSAADAFQPLSSGQSADAVIDSLQAEGYDVQINWTTGYDTKPLSECWVTGVNNPSHEAPSAGTFTTVYVDVACPNGEDGSRFDGGIGFG
jgi:hypothetical protein